MQIILAFFFLYTLVHCASNQCQNNATYSQQYDSCSCPQNFIGKNCNVSAYQLKEVPVKIPLSNSYTYTYFLPQQKVVYRFILTFCTTNQSQQIDLNIFAQEEQEDGLVYLQPRNRRDVINTNLNKDDCQKVYSQIIIQMNRKRNGELPKIIFGFKLIGQSAELQGQFLMVQCQMSSIFTANLLFTILVSFFVIITLFLLSFIVFILRKKWLQKRLIRQQQIKKMNCVNNLMPLKKYSTLVQELTQNSKDELLCSICLCEFEKDQDVRKTPCEHVYHANCLQSWCNSNFNCPICRKNFDQEQQQAIDKDLRQDNPNIRQPML